MKWSSDTKLLLNPSSLILLPIMLTVYSIWPTFTLVLHQFSYNILAVHSKIQTDFSQSCLRLGFSDDGCNLIKSRMNLTTYIPYHCFCQTKNILIAWNHHLVMPTFKSRPDIQWPSCDCKVPFNNNFLCFYNTIVKVRDNENLIW